jgi:UDP-N-acetylglucosamine:LPS N-acetylglucosamine transferase
LGIKNLSFKDSFSKFSNVKVFDFLTQKEMWYLYSICDLWISRGSATLLAEQKLRNMKLIIIPLPWTWWNHQYYNWLFYEKEYNDILVEQNSSLFLNDILSNYYWYKKSSWTILNTENSKKLIFKYLI